MGIVSPVTLEWYAASEFEKKGSNTTMKSDVIRILGAEDGFWHDAYSCVECGKVFAEFSAK